jgi:hypothetical protein
METLIDAKGATSALPVPLRELLRKAPPPKWIRDMIEHFRRTGTYRREDLERLLGDPNRRVEVRSEASLTSLLADLRGRSACKPFIPLLAPAPR